MNVPTRLLILQRLEAVLALVTPTNGFSFDLTDNVYRGRNILGEDIGDLGIGIIESPRVDSAAQFSGAWGEMRRDQWTVLLNGKIKGDDTDRAYHLQAEIETVLSRITETHRHNGEAVYPEHFMLGGLISEFHVGPPVVRPPEDIASASSFFFQPLRLEVPALVSSPYTTV